MVSALTRGETLAVEEAAAPATEMEVEVVSTLDRGDPSGWLVDEVTFLDRAFRLAVRAIENEESIGKLRQRRGRGIATADGLRIKDFQDGSLRLRLVPSIRIRRAPDSTPVLLISLACSLLGGGQVVFDYVDGPTGDVSPKAPKENRVILPEAHGDLTIHTPARSEIRLRRGKELVVIRLGDPDNSP